MLLFGLGSVPCVHAQAQPFAGRWLLDDPAPGAYTVLTVEGNRLTWSAAGKAPPACTQEFAVLPERPGTVYRDGRGKQFVAGVPGSIPTYLLRIVAGNCRGIEDGLRVSYPLIYDVAHIEVIEYVQGRPAGARRFHRKDGKDGKSGKVRQPARPPAPSTPDSTGGHPDPRNPGRP